MQALVGIALLLALAWLFGERRRQVRGGQVAVGLALQVALAFVLLNVRQVGESLLALRHVVDAMAAATTAGTSMVLGFLGGAPVPFELAEGRSFDPVFGFRILPQIMVFSVVFALLWHWRVLQVLIRGVAWALGKTLGLGGATGTAAAASVFLGLAEAPLLIRSYLQRLSRSEFFLVITCCMSTVAGSIMTAYATILAPVVEGALGHVLVASLINVVGAVVIARIMVPEEATATAGDLADSLQYDSAMDAISRGTLDGLRLVANVAAMVIVLVSLVALVNHLLGKVDAFGAPLALERVIGWLFAPVAWTMGVPWAEAAQAGALLGTKVILNEFIAYLQFAAIGDAFSQPTRVVLTYALCGFANFGSLGILIGSMGTLVPERRKELLALGPRALLAGTLVACLTGAVAGMVSRI